MCGSLAILEYLAEKFLDAGMWPKDQQVRAHARAISTEMHAGFVPLRSECGMSFWRPPGKRALSADAQSNVARVQEIWTEARSRFGAGGPFLFGKFSAADALYAPDMQAMTALPAWQEWRRAALRETWVIPKFEYDWPDVKRLPAEAA
jgi:glutathione S-transferase